MSVTVLLQLNENEDKLGLFGMIGFLAYLANTSKGYSSIHIMTKLCGRNIQKV